MARGQKAVADAIERSISQSMLRKEAEWAARFEARWTMDALCRADPGLYEALTDQIGMFHDSLGRHPDQEIVEQGEAACRGWAAAIVAMEKSGIASDAVHIGEFGDVVVAIGRQQSAPAHLIERYGERLAWLRPREVAAMYMHYRHAQAVKAIWPDAEIIGIKDKDGAE